jgi:hypothetical protein
LSSCGHFVKHWQKQIKMKSRSLVLHCSSSSKRCGHAPGRCLERLQPPLPRPKPWKKEEKRRQHPGTPLSSSQQPARCRPPWRLQSRPTASRSQARTLPARERGRRARRELQTQPGPPSRRASGRLSPGLLSL